MATLQFLLCSWGTGHFHVVFDLGFSATGPQRENSSIVQSECDELTVGIHWQDLHNVKQELLKSLD